LEPLHRNHNHILDAAWFHIDKKALLLSRIPWLGGDACSSRNQKSTTYGRFFYALGCGEN